MQLKDKLLNCDTGKAKYCGETVLLSLRRPLIGRVEIRNFVRPATVLLVSFKQAFCKLFAWARRNSVVEFEII